MNELDDLLKTKVGQLPGNRERLEAARAHSSGLGTVLAAQRKPDPVPALVEVAPVQRRSQRRVAIVVTLIRCGGKPLDDDNLTASYKVLRDSIATSFGVADNDRRIRWSYGQSPGPGAKGTVVKIDMR
jgi:hypothetical protein